jgi:hypothetical protein
VEDIDKFVEARLLLKKIGGRRLGGFFLQGPMHTLMTTILLRSTWLDAFHGSMPIPKRAATRRVGSS